MGLRISSPRMSWKSALDAEMTEHLDYDKHNAASRGSGDSRNGTRSKTVLTETGPVEIDVPRDLRLSPRSADRQELPPRQVADRHACTRPHPSWSVARRPSR